jgi:hypothetical protein
MEGLRTVVHVHARHERSLAGRAVPHVIVVDELSRQDADHGHVV